MDTPLAVLRRSSAVPNFVHVFNLFAKDQLTLPLLDITEFEHSLLPPDPETEDLFDPLVLPAVIMRLLKGCGQAYVREETCFDILRNFIGRKWHLYCHSSVANPFTVTPDFVVKTEPRTEEEVLPLTSNEISEEPAAEPLPEIVMNPNAVQTDFHSLSPSVKAETLLVLLNCWMLNHLVKTNFVDTMEADLLRISPCGLDQRGNKLYYLCGTRLYKESESSYDPETATGSFEWEMTASQPEDFASVLASLRKMGTSQRNRSLCSTLESKIIPGLDEHFEVQKTRDLERRMTLRRRRSIALQQAREKAKKERQELMAQRRSARNGEDPLEASTSGRGLSRTERYKRRSALLSNAEDDGTDDESYTRRSRPKRPVGWRIPIERTELLEAARKALIELFSRVNVEWPVYKPPADAL